MLKEQLVCLAMKAYAKAFETKERIKNSINSDLVQSYVRELKKVAVDVVENQWQKFDLSEHALKKKARDSRMSEAALGYSVSKKSGSPNGIRQVEKKGRKSSIKPAKEIGSPRADIIMRKLKSDSFRLVTKADVVDGKKSLAYLVWALGHAEEAHVAQGISVHDVSALLYQACDIELYPINISRVVYSNPKLVRQVGQEKRTKTYLLTKEGFDLFRQKFL